MKLHQILSEAPLKDYEPIGDFSKSSSFRDPRDRKMITNPNYKKVLAKKLRNTNYDINLYFVNSPQANKHTEVGGVSLEWVRENLGDEVADKVEPNYQAQNEVNIIFTNNKGAERIPMTPWIVAHRMGHAFARFKSKGWGLEKRQFRSYQEIVEAIGDYFKMLFYEVYSVNFKSGKTGPENRDHQLLMKHLAHNIGTFKSARDKNLRDFFELYNELFAQYLITGEVKFKELPKGRRTITVRNEEAYEELKDLTYLENTLEYYFGEMLSEAENYILVM